MNTQSLAIIGNSIDTLRRLAEMLSNDVNAAHGLALTPERRTSKELLLTIGVLLPKLEAARPLLESTHSLVDSSPNYPARCESCDD
jgi:hypothetical protein